MTHSFRRCALGAWALALAGWSSPLLASGGFDEAEPLLLGALVRGREVGAYDFLRIDDRFWIPLAAFGEFCSCRIERHDGATRVVTPIGTVEVPWGEIAEHDGVVYMSETTLETRLSTSLELDPARHALAFDIPWLSHGGADHAGVAPGRVADVHPPAWSVSALRSDLRYVRTGDVGSYATSTTLSGRWHPGFWRLRYEDDLEGGRRLRDYAWLHTGERVRYLAGNQRVRLHPLTRNIELTGLQVAWTELPPARQAHSPLTQGLTSRRLQPLTTIRGEGPPAGFAVLRVNGVVVDRQGIGLDGSYEFEDVSLPARRSSQVEVLLYDRADPDVPVEVREEFRTASEFLLERGGRIQTAGLGVEGNVVQEALTPGASGESAAFYQYRQGIRENLTIEGAVQHTGLATQVQAGIVSRLGGATVLSLGLAGSEGKLGYSFDLDGHRGPWRAFVRSRMSEAGFVPTDPAERYDHFLELGRRYSERFNVALIGRSRRTSSVRAEYLLPAFAWNASPTLSLRGRPDSEGDYRFDLHYRPVRSTRLTLSSVDARAYLTLRQRIDDLRELTASTEFGDGRASRQSAAVSGHVRGRWRAGWTAGALVTDGEVGYLLGGWITLVEGVQAHARYESESRADDPAAGVGSRLLVNVRANLGVSRGRLVGAGRGAVRTDLGSVAGRIRLPEGALPTGYPLADVPLVVDGRTVARTGSGGSYFVANLEPGLHEVRLGTENLPIELVPLRDAFVARVERGTVTRLDFVVRREFGLAGRVVAPGLESREGLRVELVRVADGNVRASRTDRFGLYRFDGLVPGTYVLRLAGPTGAPGEAPPLERSVEVVDDFLFGIDLVRGDVDTAPGDAASAGGDAPPR